jgi:hypothetical protein
LAGSVAFLVWFNSFQTLSVSFTCLETSTSRSSERLIKPRSNPMGGAGKRDAVADVVGAVMLDWFDVGGFDLGSAVAVDEFEARDGAAAVVGVEYDAAEHAVADEAGAVDGNSLPFDVVKEWVALLP